MKLVFDELVKQKIIDLRTQLLDSGSFDVITKVLLDKNAVVEYLSLRGNITLSGLKKIANALSKNQTLRKLKLYHYEWSEVLADMIKVNTSAAFIDTQETVGSVWQLASRPGMSFGHILICVFSKV